MKTLEFGFEWFGSVTSSIKSWNARKCLLAGVSGLGVVNTETTLQDIGHVGRTALAPCNFNQIQIALDFCTAQLYTGAVSVS